MDFQTLKRRDLQSLCKMNNVPANTTNAAMADALASLSFVEGLEFLGKPEIEGQGSPERSVITSPAVPRTTTRRKALKDELECSNLATRTRCGTSRTRAVEGTNTRKTPATRTTQKRACQVASVKKEMEKDLQAEFDADIEQSEVSENSVLGPELEGISEEVSGVSVDNEGQSSSENQSEVHNELQHPNDGQEVIDVNDIVKEAQEESNESKKVDFHSLNRKDLQNLCKKNKVPANTTNAAMADALASLEIVEGLQEFLKDYDPLAISSPLVSGIHKSCARRSRSTLKVTKEEPLSSKLTTKSCRASRRRILEETEQANDDVPEIPPAQTSAGSALCEESIQEKEDSAVPKTEIKKLELSLMDDRISSVVKSNSNLNDSLMLESTVNDSTLEAADGKEEKGNDNVLSVEPEGLVSKMDENVVEESSEDVSESNDSLLNNLADAPLVAAVDQISEEFVSESTTQVDQLLNLENVVEESSEDVREDPLLKNLVSAPLVAAGDQISKEFVSESTTQFDQLLNLEIVEESNDSPLENVANARNLPEKDQTCKEFISESITHDQILNSGNSTLEKVATVTFSSAAQIIPIELEVSNHTEDELSEKSYSMSTAQGDKISLELRGENESDNSCAEDDMSDNSDDSDSESEYDNSSTEDNMPENSDDSDSESESEGNSEEKMSEKSEIEKTIQADKLQEINGTGDLDGSDTEDSMSENSDSESDSEGSYAEEKMSEKSEIETTIQADKLLELNVESESERNQLEELDTAYDSATYGLAEDLISSNLNTISTTEVDSRVPSEKLEIATQASVYGPTKEQTSLKAKSMRELKKMLKQKLKAAELEAMAKKIENLNLEDTEKPEEYSINAPQDTHTDQPLSNDQINDGSESEVISSDVNATTLGRVDSEVKPEDAITVDVNADSYPPKSTPIKLSSKTKQPLLFTPPTKNPISTGKINRVLDVNKENVDNSAASKTEPGKIKIAITESGKVLSAMSMGKLKKEFKELQLQQSEKKRQALQSRSENTCL